uniref:Ig-like domain-containing protein n=1 Tax=Amphilophus citrinellus TaxID=61819 RepID=A0A3Q0SWD8_AMPCI
MPAWEPLYASTLFTSAVLIDTARMLQKPPEFTLPLVNHTAYIGEDVRFGVTITVHPEPRVIWHKSGQKLLPGQDDRKYTFISDKGLYQLIIRNVEIEDDAEYSVVARNRYGDDSCKARLTVVPRPKPADLTLRPMFKRVLANIECKEGQNVRFEIRVSGRPTLKWEKDGTPLAFGPCIEVVHEGLDYFILHVRDTLPEDSGVYRVTATNSAGSAGCQATLKVERTAHKPTVPAKILTKPQSLTVEEGHTARFECDVDGEPAPSITWLREGAAVAPSARHHIVSSQYNSSFEITAVEMSDEGSYSLLVENTGGKQEAHFTLTIRKSESKEKVIASPRVTSPEAKSPLAKSPEPVKSPQRIKSPEPIKSPQRVKSPVSPKSPTPKSPTPKSPTPKSPTPKSTPKSPVQYTVQNYSTTVLNSNNRRRHGCGRVLVSTE